MWGGRQSRRITDKFKQKQVTQEHEDKLRWRSGMRVILDHIYFLRGNRISAENLE